MDYHRDRESTRRVLPKSDEWAPQKEVGSRQLVKALYRERRSRSKNFPFRKAQRCRARAFYWLARFARVLRPASEMVGLRRRRLERPRWRPVSYPRSS